MSTEVSLTKPCTCLQIGVCGLVDTFIQALAIQRHHAVKRSAARHLIDIP
jgi:hypothetical protein